MLFVLKDSDPLDAVITQLITNIPEVRDDGKNEPSSLPDTQYVKAVRYSKVLPSATEQAAKVGIKNVIPTSRGGPVSPTGPLTVTIPDGPQKIQAEASWTNVKRESVITSLVPTVKLETVRRQETVLMSVQAESSADISRVRGSNPVLKRTSSVVDCEVQVGSKRQNVSYARRRERRATEPTAQLQPKSPVMEEPQRNPDEQLRLIMCRNSSVTSPSSNSPLHCIARGVPSPVSPNHGGDFISPDFQPSPGNVTLRINQTLLHSPNPNSPLQSIVCIPQNIMAGTPSPGPQSPARSGSSILEFSPAQLPLSHSPSSATFTVGVGHDSPLDTFAPASSHSPLQYTSIPTYGETTSILSPGDSYSSSLGTLDLADIFTGTNMLLPSSG